MAVIIEDFDGHGNYHSSALRRRLLPCEPVASAGGHAGCPRRVRSCTHQLLKFGGPMSRTGRVDLFGSRCWSVRDQSTRRRRMDQTRQDHLNNFGGDA
jgi:hypothetical protein